MLSKRGDTCGLGAVAGSAMVGTDLFMRVSVEAKPALYWPLLLKQSDVKWLAHTYKLTGRVAGTFLLKMKRNHCLFFCSVAGTEYRHLCWFIQPTTEQFACLALSNNTAKSGRASTALSVSLSVNHMNYLYLYLYSEWVGPNPAMGGV